MSVAPAALPMPSARCPALRPIATTKYQRDVVLRVDHQVLDDLDADVARGLEAERVDVRRQVEVVVDGLRHVDDADAARRLLRRGVIAENAVSSPPMVISCVDAEAQQRRGPRSRGSSGSLVGLAREMPRIEPPRKWMRLTSSMVSGIDVVDVALHEPLEAVADAERPRRPRARADGGRADDAVDARGGSAADEDRELSVHLPRLRVQRRCKSNRPCKAGSVALRAVVLSVLG